MQALDHFRVTSNICSQLSTFTFKFDVVSGYQQRIGRLGNPFPSKTAVLNWGCSHPQGVREGTSRGENFSSLTIHVSDDNTKSNTLNSAWDAKNDFSIRTGCGLQNELRNAVPKQPAISTT